jgi:membrane-associated phospholipid phosphatase
LLSCQSITTSSGSHSASFIFPSCAGGRTRISIPAALRQSIRTGSGRLIAANLLAVAVLTVAVTEIAVVTQLDVAITREIQGWAAGWLTELVNGITALGGSQVVIWVTAAALIGLVSLRHWRGAAALLLAVATTQATVLAAKAVMARPRPAGEMAIADPSGWSFPSGHSATAVALYVTLALIATTIWRRRLHPAIAFAVAGTIVALVGLSRIYLGAHYPTDVLAGWATGGVIVAAAWAACSWLPGPTGRPAPALRTSAAPAPARV